MLARNIRYQQDLVDQRCNSARRDWRALSLLLAHYDGCGAPEITIPRITHETLAEMVGTTRSRICHFMNRFGNRASSITRTKARCCDSIEHFLFSADNSSAVGSQFPRAPRKNKVALIAETCLLVHVRNAFVR